MKDFTPRVKPELFASMWFETLDGKHRENVDFGKLGEFAVPSVDMFPIACYRTGIEVRTEVYRRRPDGGYGSGDLICVSTSSASEELVLAIATGANGGVRYSLGNALFIAAAACERCMNILAHIYGLPWGYGPASEEASKCGTSCMWCQN